MGRFRNPRFAPEWLERKLSPSGFAGAATSAEYFVIGNTIEPPTTPSAPRPPADPDDYPLPFPVPYPIPGPGLPG